MKKTKKLKPICVERVQGKKHYDKLNGRKLQQGDWVRVLWPDNSESDHEVTVKVYRDDESGISYAYASILIAYRGIEVVVLLMNPLLRIVLLAKATPPAKEGP